MKSKIAVIGGGIFGTVIALELAHAGFKVTLFESSNNILANASRVNQARLHTGMHYPRDLETAREALGNYEKFIERFSASVKEIDQYYAVSSTNSKTSANDFLTFASKLGIDFSEHNPEAFFKPGKVDLLLKVPESTFDFEAVRKQLLKEIELSTNLNLRLRTTVENINVSDVYEFEIDGSFENFDGVVVATYSTSNLFAKMLGLRQFDLKYQLCEVALGEISNPWKSTNIGLTLMDGPFWSLMPFGYTNLYSLTDVTYTPLSESSNALLPCQAIHQYCGRITIACCDTCKILPTSNAGRMISNLSQFSNFFEFKYLQSIFTIKALPFEKENKSDARPTQVISNESNDVFIVLSGKIGSALSISEQIANQFRGNA